MGDYSVATKNRFQLSMLDNSEDEDVDLYEMLKQEEAKQQKKKPQTVEPVVTKTAKSKGDKSMNLKVKKGPQEGKVDDMNTANIQRSGTRSAKQGNESRPPRMRRNDQKSGGDDFEKPPKEPQTSGGFGGRGRRGGSAGGFRRGGGRGGGQSRRHDRHSGSDRTGVKATEKKEGGGGHNWGDEIQSQLDQEQQEGGGSSVVPAAGGGETGESRQEDGDSPAVAEESAVEAEPEVVEMTLDEWRASQAISRTAKQQFNVRRAGEGEDQSQWSSTIAIATRKQKVSSASEDEGYEEHESEVSDKLDGTRSALDKLHIEIKFASESSSGGGSMRGGPGARGGRGGRSGGGRFSAGGPRGGGDRRGRGAGFRGGFRRFSSEESAPRVDNEMEFPSLGSK